MSWRDNLVDASYKGISFKIKSSVYTAGRRTEIKNFPGNDAPQLQDFGAAETDIKIEAFVIATIDNGFDYFDERDALIAAFNAIGVGELVHPLYGTLEVYPSGKVRISETTKEGGIARLTMRFVRVNEEEQKLILPSTKQQANITIENLPTDSEDYNALIDTAVELADDNTADNYALTFKEDRASIGALVSSIKGAIQNIQATVFRIKGAISDIISTVTGTLSGILSTLNNIINAPCSLMNSILNAGDVFLSLCGIGEGGLFGGTAGFCSGTLRGETTLLDGETVPSELGESVITECLVVIDEMDEANINSFIPDSQIVNVTTSMNAFKYSVLTSIMQVCIRTNFLNKEDAIRFSNLIGNAMNDFLSRLGDQQDTSNYEYLQGNFIDNSLLFSSVEDLRKVFIQAMLAKSNQISSAIDYEVKSEVLSTLELAYNKYEDLGREEEIQDMNKGIIAHPSFIPSGETIRILDE